MADGASRPAEWACGTEPASPAESRASKAGRLEKQVGTVADARLQEVRASLRALVGWCRRPHAGKPAARGKCGETNLRLVELTFRASVRNERANRSASTSLTHLNSTGAGQDVRVRRDAGTFTFEGVIRKVKPQAGNLFVHTRMRISPRSWRSAASRRRHRQDNIHSHVPGEVRFCFCAKLRTKQAGIRQAANLRYQVHTDGTASATLYGEMAPLTSYKLGTLNPLITSGDITASPGLSTFASWPIWVTKH